MVMAQLHMGTSVRSVSTWDAVLATSTDETEDARVRAGSCRPSTQPRPCASSSAARSISTSFTSAPTCNAVRASCTRLYRAITI